MRPKIKRVLRDLKFTGISFVKDPPDPRCTFEVIKSKAPTVIEDDPGIECPSCSGEIVERISFKPGTTQQQAQLWLDEQQARARALGSVWVCLRCGHEEKRF